MSSPDRLTGGVATSPDVKLNPDIEAQN